MSGKYYEFIVNDTLVLKSMSELKQATGMSVSSIFARIKEAKKRGKNRIDINGICIRFKLMYQLMDVRSYIPNQKGKRQIDKLDMPKPPHLQPFTEKSIEYKDIGSVVQVWQNGSLKSTISHSKYRSLVNQ